MNMDIANGRQGWGILGLDIRSNEESSGSALMNQASSWTILLRCRLKL